MALTFGRSAHTVKKQTPEYRALYILVILMLQVLTVRLKCPTVTVATTVFRLGDIVNKYRSPEVLKWGHEIVTWEMS